MTQAQLRLDEKYIFNQKSNLDGSPVWQGIGYCPGHFGELLQGAFLSPNGKSNIRGLITLPCRKIGTTVWVGVYEGSGKVIIEDDKTKVKSVIKNFKEKIASKLPSLQDITTNYDIVIKFHSTIQPGIGMGSSTADIVATIRALSHTFGVVISTDDVIKLTLSAEKACDSTMLCQTVKLFAQRDGYIIENYGRAFMPFVIHGFNLMPGKLFLTDEMSPAEYTCDDIESFNKLQHDIRTALHENNLEKVARVATESSVINQKYYPKNLFNEFLEIQKQSNFLGVCISHSGTIAGLITPAKNHITSKDFHKIKAKACQYGMSYIGLFKI